MKNFMQKSFLGILLLMTGTGMSAQNTRYVTTTADSGEGSLRQLVADAAPDDSIVIPSEYIITLNSQIVFNNNLKLNGQNAVVQVAEPGVSKYKIFVVGSTASTATTAVSLDLYNLKLIGGNVTGSHNTASNILNCGAGITLCRYGKLKAENVTVENAKGNYCGAVFVENATCKAEFLRCAFIANEGTTANGGAVTLKGDCVVDQCLFENNIAKGNGSGIAAYGKTEITNTTFRGNQAAGNSGGVVVNYAQANGDVNISSCLFDSNIGTSTTGSGAIVVTHSNATTSLVNNTFYNNTGGLAGAILYEPTNSDAGGSLTCIHNTVAGNFTTGNQAGGIYLNNRGTAEILITMVNNIVAYNYNVQGLSDVTVTSKPHLLEGTHNVFGTFTGQNDCVATIDFSYNPESALFADYVTTGDIKVPELADNEGFTKTIAINRDGVAFQSAAFSYGDPEMVPDVDQRGVVRFKTPCVGAFELNSGVSLNPVSKANTTLYPVPVKDVLNVAGDPVSKVEFFDLSGKNVKTVLMPGNQIQLDGLAAGVYVIRLVTSDAVTSQRVVVL